MQFEVIFLFVSAFKIVLLMPDVFLYEINWLFYSLALNSALAYTLSYELRTRTKTVLGSEKTKLATGWYIARMLFLAFIMITPFFNFFFDDDSVHYLVCTPVIAYNFLAIFILDAISTLVDLGFLFFNPKAMTKRKRLKIMKKKALANI
jgi:hypothetical protein